MRVRHADHAKVAGGGRAGVPERMRQAETAPQKVQEVSEIRQYDCRTCGSCCRPGPGDLKDGYVGLSEQEAAWFEKIYGRRVVVTDVATSRKLGEPSLHLATKVEDGERSCVFHSGMLGDSSTCMVYLNRPEACSSFQNGDTDCVSSREEDGLPV